MTVIDIPASERRPRRRERSPNVNRLKLSNGYPYPGSALVQKVYKRVVEYVVNLEFRFTRRFPRLQLYPSQLTIDLLHVDVAKQYRIEQFTYRPLQAKRSSYVGSQKSAAEGLEKQCNILGRRKSGGRATRIYAYFDNTVTYRHRWHDPL